MRDSGLELDFAEHGGITVRKAVELPRDLILMDPYMPEMDGFEATRAIRRLSDYAATPIIAFAEDRAACLDAGMNDHLPKPVDPEVIYAALDRWRAAAPV